MAIAVKTLEIHEIPAAGGEFYISASSADASGTEEILAAVARASHYVSKIIIKCCPAAAAVITVSIGSGETTGALTTAHLDLIPFSGDAGAEFRLDLGKKGIKFVEGQSIAIDASAAGLVHVYIEGKTCKLAP